MKLRTQHVSNSSSSSFYMFSKEEDTFTDVDKCTAFVKKFLLPNGNIYSQEQDVVITPEAIAGHIMSQHNFDMEDALGDLRERIEDYGKWASDPKEMFLRNYALNRMQECENMERYVKDTVSFAHTSWADEDGEYWSKLEHETEPCVIDGEGVIRQSNH